MAEPRQYLWETPDTGPLDTAGYPVAAQESNVPSLSGPVPRYSVPASGQASGTDDGGYDSGGSNASVQRMPQPVHGQNAYQKPRPLTPEEMLQLANQMEAGMLAQHEARMALGASVGQPETPTFPFGQSYANTGGGFPARDEVAFGYGSDSGLDHTGQDSDGSVPEWLQHYMTESSPTDLDPMLLAKYGSERQRLTELRNSTGRNGH